MNDGFGSFLSSILVFVFMAMLVSRSLKAGKKKTADTLRAQMKSEQHSENAAKVETHREERRQVQNRQNRQKQQKPQKSQKPKTAPSYEEGFGTPIMVSDFEYETEAQHRAHLMNASLQGESEEEHAKHMRNAEASAADGVKREKRSPYFRDAADLRRAVVAREILDAPLALRNLRR